MIIIKKQQQSKLPKNCLQCFIDVRFPEDSSYAVNGNKLEEDDNKGTILKEYLGGICFYDDQFIYAGQNFGTLVITIDIDKGVVIDWPKNFEAKFCCKSVDINIFKWYKDGKLIHSTPDDDTEYVIGPDWMNEFGDYFLLHVMPDGSIAEYNKTELLSSLKEWAA